MLSVSYEVGIWPAAVHQISVIPLKPASQPSLFIPKWRSASIHIVLLHSAQGLYELHWLSQNPYRLFSLAFCCMALGDTIDKEIFPLCFRTQDVKKKKKSEILK